MRANDSIIYQLIFDHLSQPNVQWMIVNYNYNLGWFP